MTYTIVDCVSKVRISTDDSLEAEHYFVMFNMKHDCSIVAHQNDEGIWETECCEGFTLYADGIRAVEHLRSSIVAMDGDSCGYCTECRGAEVPHADEVADYMITDCDNDVVIDNIPFRLVHITMGSSSHWDDHGDYYDCFRGYQPMSSYVANQ